MRSGRARNGGERGESEVPLSLSLSVEGEERWVGR